MDDPVEPRPNYFTMPFQIEKPVIPSMFASFSHAAASGSSLFGGSRTPPPTFMPSTFNPDLMVFSLSEETNFSQGFPQNATVKLEDGSIPVIPDASSLPIAGIDFSMFNRQFQVDKLLGRLMKDAITNSLDWKSMQGRELFLSLRLYLV